MFQEKIYHRYTLFQGAIFLTTLLSYWLLVKSQVLQKDFKTTNAFILGTEVQDSDRCRNKSQLATWSELKADSLQNVLKFQMCLAITIFILLKVTQGCCDRIFIGGAKPQILCILQILFQGISYVQFVKYFLAVHTFQNNVSYILEGKAQKCFGPATHYEAFLDIYTDSEAAVKTGIIPVFVQGVSVALLSIFLYLMCKLYGF